MTKHTALHRKRLAVDGFERSVEVTDNAEDPVAFCDRLHYDGFAFLRVVVDGVECYADAVGESCGGLAG